MNNVASGLGLFGDCTHALPQELWDRILNGADAQGRPFFDVRYRCLARMVCSRWHATVSTPSETDALHIIAASPRGRRFCCGDVSVHAQRTAVAPAYASTAADLFAMTAHRGALAVGAVHSILCPGGECHRTILLAAMAASGVDDHFDYVLSIIGKDAPCVDLGREGKCPRTDASFLQRAAYIACVERGYVRGAEALASAMTERQWAFVLGDIIEADRAIALGTALVQVSRRCKPWDNKSPTDNNAHINASMMAHAAWSAISEYGTLSTTQTILCIQKADVTSPLDVGGRLRRALKSQWHSKEWLRGVVRCDRRGVIEAHTHLIERMATTLEYAVECGQLGLAKWLGDLHRKRGGTGICGIAPADVAAQIRSHWGDNADDGWCWWLASYGYGPTDDDTRRILGRDRWKGPRCAPFDYIERWPQQSALADGGDCVISVLCADPPRFEWSVRERAMRTLAPFMLPRATPIPNGLWSQAVARVTARIIKMRPRANDTLAALLWLCRKARRWGLVGNIDPMQFDDAHPSARLCNLSDIAPEADIWSVWVGTVSPLPSPVVNAAWASCDPPTDLASAIPTKRLLRLLCDHGLAVPIPSQAGQTDAAAAAP
ncbi:F-box domain containing protein [Pandoravirus neocaledonia]|uniref:F-box domain containing protein n=1 Tax=Pandoravirus neocaledonia TaxID=2107708 RepID=A0A2U7UD81_9VIRU|nr:F-box domain containing protein [Pandoravirus neocaledonia]AVK76315.1 F-box domain containing protein [Pandoravirus neocaledonia]